MSTLRKRVECECGWSFEGVEDVLVATVVGHCENVHDGRVPPRDDILATAKPVGGQGHA